MDDVHGLADRSNTFVNFLFGYHCVYIFHIILLEKEIWKKISAYTVARLQQSNVLSTTTKCLLARSLWINKLFTELANGNEKNMSYN